MKVLFVLSDFTRIIYLLYVVQNSWVVQSTCRLFITNYFVQNWQGECDMCFLQENVMSYNLAISGSDLHPPLNMSLIFENVDSFFPRLSQIYMVYGFTRVTP